MSPLANTAIIVLAAGRGERFGQKKQFMQISGKSMLWWSLETIAKLESVAQTILVLPQTDHSDAARLIGTHTVSDIVVGGSERTDSVRSALAVLSDDIEVVLVHDAARPLASPELFSSVIEGAKTAGSALPCVEVADTIKEIEGDRVVATLDRARLRAAQTPQGFSRDLLVAAYGSALAGGIIGTDDASLVEAMDVDVTVIPGERDNIKVTSPRDAQMVELIMDLRKGLS